MKAGNPSEAAKEVGDILFAFVNLARYHGVEPEEALRQATSKFMKRFAHIEKRLAEHEIEWQAQSLEELDQWWNEAKSLGIGGRKDED